MGAVRWFWSDVGIGRFRKRVSWTLNELHHWENFSERSIQWWRHPEACPTLHCFFGESKRGKHNSFSYIILSLLKIKYVRSFAFIIGEETMCAGMCTYRTSREGWREGYNILNQIHNSFLLHAWIMNVVGARKRKNDLTCLSQTHSRSPVLSVVRMIALWGGWEQLKPRLECF